MTFTFIEDATDQ